MSIWNSFGWCGPHFQRLNEADPTFVNRLAELDLGGLHFAALVVHCWTERGQKDPERLAQDLGRTRRQELVERYLPSRPPGLLNNLPKLGRRIASRRHYRTLLTLLSQRNAAKLVRHRTHLSPAFLDGLARIPDSFCVGPAVAALATDKASVDYLLYALEVLARARPGLKKTTLQQSLANQSVGFRIINWLEDWLKDCPFPKAPFPADDTLKPIEDVQTLETMAKSFRNCLADKATQVVAGQRYYYVWDTPRKVVVELMRDPLLGWRLGEVRGPGNRSVERAIDRKIRSHLHRQGVLASMPDLEPDPLGLTW